MRNRPMRPEAVKPCRRGALVFLAGAVTAACSAPGQSPRTAPGVIKAAKREGQLTIYSNTSMESQIAKGFKALFPEIKIRFIDSYSNKIHEDILAEASSAAPRADLVWSSSMDNQIKLINDGYAQTYKSPERVRLPEWALWRNQGFGLTAEPIGFAYNRRLLAFDEVPKSHAQLLSALHERPEAWRRRIALYDPRDSGVALLHLSADIQAYADTWPLMDAIGDSDPLLVVSGQHTLDAIASGKRLFAYNMNLAYAARYAAERDSDIGVIIPSDYNLLISRVAFIPRTAPHANAARLFLDYLLSAAGAAAMEMDYLPSAAALSGKTAATTFPVRVGPALLANLDQARRAHLLQRWTRAVQGRPRPMA